jgi:hypothetical protein
MPSPAPPTADAPPPPPPQQQQQPPSEARLNALDLFRRVDQAAYTAEMPLYPARVLQTHCLMKGLEWSALGLALWPLAAWRYSSFAATFRPVFLGLPALGILGSTALLVQNVRASDVAGVDDRAFRILKNKGQVAVDRKASVGAAVGSMFGAVVMGNPSGVLATASLGIALAVAYHAVEMDETKAAAKKLRELLR